MGYTLNRVSLFALIFSIGILVDDAIVVIENIARHWAKDKGGDRIKGAIAAVAEVGNPNSRERQCRDDLFVLCGRDHHPLADGQDGRSCRNVGTWR
jgi:hypothetical protein